MRPLPRGNERSVSPVISVILVVAITVVLAATISVFVLGIGEKLQDPGPNVAESSGEFVSGTALDKQIVRITHIAGDSVPAEELEVVVDATDACGQRDRIINLPADRTGFGENGFADENFEQGASTFLSQGGTFGQEWSPGVLHVNNDNTFDAGSKFEFRIKQTCEFDEGEELTVRVVHTPTNSVILIQDITA